MLKLTGLSGYCPEQSIARRRDSDYEKLERVSKIPPKGDPEASEVEEVVVGGEQMLMTNQKSAKLSEPARRSSHRRSASAGHQRAKCEPEIGPRSANSLA